MVSKARRALGIRASLLLAFLAISGFVVLASGTALQALLQVSFVLEDITARRTPAMVASLDLSRQVERFVAAAQQLSVVESRDDYRDRSAELDSHPLLAALERIHSDKADMLREIVGRLTALLAKLDAVVSDRLTVSEQKTEALHELLNTDLAFQYATRPVQRALFSDAITLEFSVSRPQGASTPAALVPSIKGLLALNRLRHIEIAFARAHDMLLIGATAASSTDLQLTSLAITRALAELDQAVAEAPPDLESALAEAAKLRPQFEAPNGLLPLHKRELDDRQAAGGLLAETRAVSRQLMSAVDELVRLDSERVVQGAAEATAVRRASIGRLLVVIAASLGCSALIVWLYVNRRIVARLDAVRDSMLALALGRLSEQLPAEGEDEIGRMAAALRTFRETAIERDRTLFDVATLLDNSGEGFLSFGGDLVVDPRCSRACTALLGVAPAGRDAALVLFGEDQGKRELLKEVLASVLAEEDPVRRGIMLSLLPDQLSCAGRLLEVGYKMLDNGHLMVVLTDITERQRLADTLTREHRHLSMVVAAVSENHDFFYTVAAFRHFVTEEMPRLTSVQDLYREIHTYKGVLAQFSFSQTPVALHALEEKLAELARRSDRLSPGEIAGESLIAALEAELDGLRAILGEDFVAGGARVTLTAAQADRLERLAAQLLDGQPGETALLEEIRYLRRVPMRDIVVGYGKLVEQIAERLEKRVAPVEVQGGEDIRVDPRHYGALLRSLAHVFRNAVAHGIEAPERRRAAGKPESGRIICSIARAGDSLTLSVADDGAGLDLPSLRRKAVDAGLYTAEAVAALGDGDVAGLVFADSLSTRDEADDISGRGVGLAAVRAEARKLGGEATVLSSPGAGVRFEVTVPLAG